MDLGNNGNTIVSSKRRIVYIEGYLGLGGGASMVELYGFDVYSSMVLIRRDNICRVLVEGLLGTSLILGLDWVVDSNVNVNDRW